MKPINHKERSKQVWQFIFIFFALALVPVALIFFAYHKVPEALSEQEQEKLVNYSNFDRSQKVLVRHLADIDSNINLMASGTSNELPEVIRARVAKSLENIRETDTSRLLSLVTTGYGNHLKHVDELVAARKKAENSGAGTEELQKKLDECKETIEMLRARSSVPMPPQ